MATHSSYMTNYQYLCLFEKATNYSYCETSKPEGSPHFVPL